MKALNGGKQMRSDWRIPLCSGNERLRVNGEKAHPTQKPEALLERVIRASSNPGDVVLDPFFGTGTTGAVAKRLRRQWIGIEREAAYIDVARERIERMMPEANEKKVTERSDTERVAFKRLLAERLIQPGTVLVFRRDPEVMALVRGDGRLQYRDLNGTIHTVARMLAGAPCNGWQHWYYTDEAGELQPLDVLREKLRG